MWRLFASLLLFIPCSFAQAQEKSPWLGQTVVIKNKSPLRVGTKVVDDGRAFRVEETIGNQLWLVDGSIAGWVSVDSVVRLDQSIAYFTDQIKTYPKSAYFHLKRGAAWKLLNKSDKAIADYDEAIHLDPNSSPAYNNRGNAWRDTGRYVKAIADYTEAIRLSPTDPFPLRNRGEVYSRTKEYGKLVADFAQVTRLDPNDAIAFNNCAWFCAT